MSYLCCCLLSLSCCLNCRLSFILPNIAPVIPFTAFPAACIPNCPAAFIIAPIILILIVINFFPPFFLKKGGRPCIIMHRCVPPRF
ncbi:MAG: hypothetical protein [Microviridae sp.]|nr:MAG: hypothetical protein [Microviridae sp.]